MISELKKIAYIIDNKFSSLYIIVIFFLVGALLDLFGIGIIIPYTQVILNQGKLTFISEYKFLSFLQSIEYINLVILISFALVSVIIIKTLFQIFINYVLIRFETSLHILIRKKLINSYLFLDYKEYINFKTEKAITHINRLAVYVSKSVIVPILKIVSDIILILSISVFLAFIDFFIFLSITSFLIFAVFLYHISFKKILFDSAKNIRSSYQHLLKDLRESTQGYKEFTVLNAMPYFLSKISYSLNITFSAEIKSKFFTSLPSLLTELLIIGCFIIIVLIKIIFFNTDFTNEIPIFSAFAYAAFKLFPKFTSLSQNLALINGGRYAIPSIYEALYSANNKLKQYRSENKNYVNIKNENFMNLQFKNVSFSYNKNSKIILDKINFNIDSSSIIGIYGPSGSGKTTFVDIFLKFLEPINGEIVFNKRINFIKNVNINHWHEFIYYIPQKITLINGSILENITLKKDINDVDQNRLNNSIKLSRCDKFIYQFEEKLNYEIGESGRKLSGGQLQRVALARSFYHNKKIIVLDEATNSLDMKVEEEILSDLKSIKSGYTLIIITHRENVLRFCDKVFYLDHS